MLIGRRPVLRGVQISHQSPAVHQSDEKAPEDDHPHHELRLRLAQRAALGRLRLLQRQQRAPRGAVLDLTALERARTG